MRFFELLGVTDAAAATAAWPADRLAVDTADGDVPGLMTYLQESLRFTAVRPGAAQPGTTPGAQLKVGLAAELHVVPAPLGPPLVLAQLSKLGFALEATKDVPAHFFVTQGPGGVEVAIHGLPVAIRFPPGLFMPRRTAEERAAAVGDLPDVRVAPPPPPIGPIDGFDANQPDSVEIVLSDESPSIIRVRVNVRMTELGDCYFDTAVPLSIGACRFSGLPVKGLHDLQIIPNPAPVDVVREHLDAELPLEWKRHNLDVIPADGVAGLLAIRTVDLDMDAKPWSTWGEKLRADRSPPADSDDAAVAADPDDDDANLAKPNAVELVVEDLVIPFYRFGILPFPVHGRFGLRRQILVGNSSDERYHLDAAPVDLKVGPVMIRLFRLLLQTTDLEGEAPIEFDAVVQRNGAPLDQQNRWSFPLSFTEAGELIAGGIIPVESRPPVFFTVFGREIRLAGFRLGLSLPEVKALIEGDGSATSAFAVLADIELRPRSATPGPVTLASKSGAPADASMYFEDVGWRFGKPSLGAIAGAADLELKLFDRFSLRIEDVALVTEDNGGFYVSVSASLEKSFGSSDGKPPADTTHGACTRTSAGRTEALARGVGVHLHRLRTRIAGDDDAPRFLLDGVSVFISIGRVEISGFGALSEYDLAGNHYSEIAAGLQICFAALGKNFDLGFEMYKGRVTGQDEFGYGLFAMVLGGLPIGSLELKGLRVLVTENLAPRLAPVDGTDQPMRLYRWYKDNLDAVELPQHRALTAWMPRDQTSAFGAAASLTFAGTKAIHLDAFFFQIHSPDEDGLVGGLELYALKAPQPLAFAAFEWDDEHDKWGLTIGFHVGLQALFGNIASWLGEITLAGLLFFGNKPDTIAIGQYNDTTTWPSLRVQFNRFWKLDVFVGFCWHRVDAADALDPSTESVNVVGAIVSAKGTVKFGIGTFKVYFTLSWASGQWRNEAVATGHMLVIEAGIRIRLFGCFNFGASVHVDHAVLGPGPSSYRRTSTVIRIETPWWLPDVTVRWSSVSGAPMPAEASLISRPLIAASAIGPGPRVATPIGVAGVDAASPPVVYAMTAIRALAPPITDDAALAALPLVSCDSEIALDFKPSLDASATVLPGTAAGAGRQRSNELSVTYELVAIGIRRRRRYGPTAGAWTDLVDPVQTELDALAELPPAQWQAAFQSVVGFDWDADVVRLGRLDPRRLLINAVTPYSFLSSNPEGDEVLAASQPGWPCCTPVWPKPRWHLVDFVDTAVGDRTPVTERFTESTSTLHWIGGRPPIVVLPTEAPSGTRVARVAVDDRGPGTIAIATFDPPAAICEVHAYWAPVHSTAKLVIDAYRGLTLIESHTFAMSADDPGAAIRVAVPAGVTSLVIRKDGPRLALGADPRAATVELVGIRYQTAAGERRAALERARCQAQDARFHGQGRLAWLPNSDYEITIKTRAVLAYTRTGAEDATMEQRALFRTKGLPGLNAVARVGEELEPYVESVYPPPSTTLYRREPIALAFNERFNVLAPIDRTPTAADPEERQRMMRWLLAIEQAGADGVVRVSQTSPDWIVDHRPQPVPPQPRRPALLDAVSATPIRRAVSLEPLRVRLDRMVSRPGGCGGPDATLHTSQLLTHAPYDPELPDVAAPRWPARRGYRVDLRLQGAPFVDRAPFEADDVAALAPRTAAGAGAPWQLADGAIRGPAGTTGAQYALFGDGDWDHVHVVAAIDPRGGAAGVAAAVGTGSAGEVTRAAIAWIDERGGLRLRLEVRDGGAVVEERAAELPVTTPRPFILEVTIFDDVIRAGVAATEVELARGNVREGRMALVTDGDGAIARLTVRGLDGYRFHFTTSRYDGFVDHIASFGGAVGVVRPGDLGLPMTTTAALLASTSGELTAAMTPGADTGARDRLLAQWLAGLALPAREAPQQLELTRHEVEGSTGVILVESPEPLPLGGDVALIVRRRQPTLPPFPRPPRRPPMARVPERRPPRAAEAWAGELELDRDRSSAPALPESIAKARRLVLAVAAPDGTTDLRTFAVRPAAGRSMLELIDVRPALWAARVLARLAVGDVALLDDLGALVLTDVPLPVSPFHWVDVPVRLLTSADARRALIIPISGSLPPATYQLTFSIDRARWRAAVPDATSAYRATHTLTVSW